MVKELSYKKARRSSTGDTRQSTSFEEEPSGITLVDDEHVDPVKRSGYIPYIDLSKVRSLKTRSRTAKDKLHITKVPREKIPRNRPQSLST